MSFTTQERDAAIRRSTTKLRCETCDEAIDTGCGIECATWACTVDGLDICDRYRVERKEGTRKMYKNLKLKPCPFCGHSGKTFRPFGSDVVYPGCPNESCVIQPSVYNEKACRGSLSNEELIGIWNTRKEKEGKK